MGQEGEYQPSKHEAQSSNSNTAKKGKENERNYN
jgi:hypothetical protein